MDNSDFQVEITSIDDNETNSSNENSKMKNSQPSTQICVGNLGNNVASASAGGRERKKSTFALARMEQIDGTFKGTQMCSPSTVETKAQYEGELGDNTFQRDIRMKKHSIGVGMNLNAITGLEMAAVIGSTIKPIKTPTIDTTTADEVTVDIVMPNGVNETFGVHSTIQTLEICTQARERHLRVDENASVDSMYIFLKAPTKPARKLFDNEMPLLAINKIYKMLNEDRPGVYRREQIKLELQTDKKDVMLSVNLSTDTRALFKVPQSITAGEMIEKARCKYNRLHNIPDYKNIPLVLEVTAPGKNDKRVELHECLMAVVEEIKKKNAYINPERVKFTIVQDEGQNVDLGMRMREMSQKFKGTPKEMALYQNVVMAMVCSPDLGLEIDIDETFRKANHKRRNTLRATGTRLNFADIEVLKDLCCEKVDMIICNLDEEDVDQQSNYDYDKPEVAQRMLARILNSYSTDFLLKNARKLVMLEDTTRDDFVEIYEKTVWKTMEEQRHSAEQCSHQLLLEDKVKKRWGKLLENLRERQMGEFNMWMTVFHSNMTSMESIKAQREDKKELDADTDVDVSVGMITHAHNLNTDQVSVDDWGDGIDIFDWNDVTEGKVRGIPYSDNFNRSMCLIQRSLDIPEALHRQTVMCTINAFNSNPEKILRVIDRRQERCETDTHPYYTNDTLPRNSYERWKETETSEINALRRHVENNNQEYINKVSSQQLTRPVLSAPDIEPLSSFKAVLHLTILELENAKKCTLPYVQVKIGAVKLRTDTAKCDTVEKRAKWSDTDALVFTVNDAAEPVELQVLEETEGINSCFRKLLGKLNVPVHEVIRLGQGLQALETETRWFDLFPVGRVCIRIECLCEPMVNGICKSGNVDVCWDLFSTGSNSWHVRFLVASQIGGQVSFDFFAPDSQTIRSMLEKEDTKHRPTLKEGEPGDTLMQEKSTSSGLSETEDFFADVMNTQKTVEINSDEEIEGDVLKTGILSMYMKEKEKSEDVTLILTANGLSIKSDEMVKTYELKNVNVLTPKRFWKDSVMIIVMKDDKYKFKAESKMIRDNWYKSIQQACSAKATKALLLNRQHTSTIRRMLGKKGDSDDTEGERQSDTNAGFANDAEMKRKSSMMALSQFSKDIAVRFGAENLAENDCEKAHLAARRAKFRRILTRDFHVEKAAIMDGSEELSTVHVYLADQQISLKFLTQDKAEEWFSKLSEMRMAAYRYRYTVCTESQANLARAQLEAQLEAADVGTYEHNFLRKELELLVNHIETQSIGNINPEHYVDEYENEVDFNVDMKILVNALHEATLTSSAVWMLRHFSTFFGFREGYKHSLITEDLTQKIYQQDMNDTLRTNIYHDVLLKVFNIIEKEAIAPECREYVGEIYDARGVPMTKIEKDTFSATLDRLDSLTCAHLIKYKDWFPYAKGGLSQVMKILKAVESLRWHTGLGMTDLSTVRSDPPIEKRFERKVKKLLTAAVEERFACHMGMSDDSGEQQYTPTQMSELISAVFAELSEDSCFYAPIFESYVDYIPHITHLYANMLKPGIIDILNEPKWPDYELFKTYFQLKRVGDSNDKASMTPILVGYLDLVEEWMKKVNDQTVEWTDRAIEHDTFVPLQDGSLHSSSVLDMFCYLTDSYNFIENLQWPESHTRMSLYGWYGQLLCRTMEQYFDKMGVICENTFLAPSRLTQRGKARIWDTRFFTIINDLEMAMSQYKKIYVDIRKDCETQLAMDEPNTNKILLIARAAEKLSFFSESFKKCAEVRSTIISGILKTMQSAVIKGVLGIFEMELCQSGVLSIRDNVVPIKTKLGKSGDLESELHDMLAPMIEYLDARLAILTAHVHFSAFKTILKSIWVMILKNITAVCCPKDKNVVWSLSETITTRQYTICTHSIQIIFDFFFAEGDGLSMEELRNEEMTEAMEMLARCAATTRELVDTYNSKTCTQQERENIEWVAKTRTKDDMALSIVRALENKRRDERLAKRERVVSQTPVQSNERSGLAPELQVSSNDATSPRATIARTHPYMHR
eukprot:CFRG6856T1